MPTKSGTLYQGGGFGKRKHVHELGMAVLRNVEIHQRATLGIELRGVCLDVPSPKTLQQPGLGALGFIELGGARIEEMQTKNLGARRSKAHPVGAFASFQHMIFHPIAVARLQNLARCRQHALSRDVVIRIGGQRLGAFPCLARDPTFADEGGEVP